MKVIDTPIKDLKILEPKVFGDSRGYFFESFNSKTFTDLGLSYNFVQDNESFSSYGTIRGLHFQRGEYAQAKLVRVIEGKVLDVVIDLRPDSATFKQSFQVELSSENKRMFLVPRGFAHGFAVLSKQAYFAYKCDNYYSPNHESGLIFNDQDLSIDWQIKSEDQIISSKDLALPTLQQYLKSL